MEQTLRTRTLLVTGIAVAGVILGVAGTVTTQHLAHHAVAHDNAPSTAPPAPPLLGTVDLLGSTSSVDANINMTHDNRCFGRGAYAYLDAEAPVTISDPVSGKTLGTAKLSQGTLYDGVCQFTFVMPRLPSQSTYTVRVDGQLPSVVSQVRVQTGLILRTGFCCLATANDPGALS